MRRCLPLVVLGLVGASPAAALDLPTRKAGLWEVKTITEGRNAAPQTMQQCVDAATDKLLNSMGSTMSQGMCSKQEIKKVGNTIVIDAVCKVGPMTSTSKSIVSGDFNSAYTVKVSSKLEGAAIPGMPGGVSNSTIEAKWTGPCKADQKPGDVIMANGMKMNIRNLGKLPGMPGGPPPR